MLKLFEIIFMFYLGACIGSFVCCCADRMCRNEPVFKAKRSHCVSCGKELTLFELFPVISYLALKGKCSGCKNSIPPICFMSEVSLGVVFASAWYCSGLSFAASSIGDLFCDETLFILFSCFVLFGAVTDYIEQNVYITPILAGMGICFIANAAVHGLEHALHGVFFGAIGFGSIYVINFFSRIFLHKEGIGSGDGYLFALAGLALGGKFLYYFVTVGFILGAVFAIKERKMQKDSRDNPADKSSEEFFDDEVGLGEGNDPAAFPLVPFLYAGLVPAYVLFKVM